MPRNVMLHQNEGFLAKTVELHEMMEETATGPSVRKTLSSQASKATRNITGIILAQLCGFHSINVAKY